MIYAQGMGWNTLEELKWSPEGQLLTTNFTTYKIPTVTDIPVEFNVTLLPSTNPRAVYSSKVETEQTLHIILCCLKVKPLCHGYSLNSILKQHYSY